MGNVIKVVPDKDGRLFIKMYGTRYEIVVDKPKAPEPISAKK